MAGTRPAGGRSGARRDFLDADGRNVWGDIRLSELDAAGIGWHFLPRDTDERLAPDIDGLDAVLLAGPAVTARTFADVTRPPLLFARFGVGYDAVDLDDCARNGVLVTITPDGARRPVATAALTLLLSVLHNVPPRTGWYGRDAGPRRSGGWDSGSPVAASVCSDWATSPVICSDCSGPSRSKSSPTTPTARRRPPRNSTNSPRSLRRWPTAASPPSRCSPPYCRWPVRRRRSSAADPARSCKVLLDFAEPGVA